MADEQFNALWNELCAKGGNRPFGLDDALTQYAVLGGFHVHRGPLLDQTMHFLIRALNASGVLADAPNTQAYDRFIKTLVQKKLRERGF